MERHLFQIIQEDRDPVAIMMRLCERQALRVQSFCLHIILLVMRKPGRPVECLNLGATRCRYS